MIAFRHRTPQRTFKPFLEILESRTVLTAGQLDPTFGVMGNGIADQGAVAIELQGNDLAKCVAVQPDGKIVVAGATSTSPLSPAVYAIVRYNPNGTVDATFGNNGIVLGGGGEDIEVVAVEANGIIIAAGKTSQSGAIFGFNSNGSPDLSFGVNGVVSLGGGAGALVPVMRIQPDGKIVGMLAHFDVNEITVFRLNENGTPDSSFAANPITFSQLPNVAFAPNGQIYVGAIFGTALTVFRLNPNGSTDLSFGSNGSLQTNDGSPYTLTVQPDGRLIIAHLVSQFQPGGPAVFVNRLNMNGTPDETFGSGGTFATPFVDSPSFMSTFLSSDGLIHLVVAARTYPQIDLVWLNPNGTSNRTGVNVRLSSEPNVQATDFGGAAFQPDGKLVVVGQWENGITNFDFLALRLLGDTPTGTHNQQLVSQIYLDLLERPADPAGLAYWSGVLDGGKEMAQQIAMQIEQSQEYHQLAVEQFYSEYLHRAADPGGLAGWTNFLNNGGTKDQMRAAFLGSAEYFSVSGSSNASFVASLYNDVLGRPADSAGAQAWGQLLSNGLSREVVAAAIMRSGEGNDAEISELYFWLLHRAPDTAGLQSFAGELSQGIPLEAIVAAMVGSSEYAATRV